MKTEILTISLLPISKLIFGLILIIKTVSIELLNLFFSQNNLKIASCIVLPILLRNKLFFNKDVTRKYLYLKHLASTAISKTIILGKDFYSFFTNGNLNLFTKISVIYEGRD